MKKMANNMPSIDLVEGYLTEIARGYGVRWKSDPKQVGDDQSDEARGLVVSRFNSHGGISSLIFNRKRLNMTQEIKTTNLTVGNSLTAVGPQDSRISPLRRMTMGKGGMRAPYLSPRQKMTSPY
jgi:hypothetical protein